MLNQKHQQKPTKSVSMRVAQKQPTSHNDNSICVANIYVAFPLDSLIHLSVHSFELVKTHVCRYSFHYCRIKKVAVVENIFRDLLHLTEHLQHKCEGKHSKENQDSKSHKSDQ